MHVSQNNVSVVNPLDASSCRSGDARDVWQESASMAWARAFYALAQGLKPGDRIATGVIEYGANYVAMLQVITRSKNATFGVVVLPIIYCVSR